MKTNLGQENLTMVRWMRWHCPLHTGSEIRALMVPAQARYLSVKEVPHNIESVRVSEEEIYIYFFSDLNVRTRDETRDLRLSKQAAWTTTPDNPQLCDIESEMQN